MEETETKIEAEEKKRKEYPEIIRYRKHGDDGLRMEHPNAITRLTVLRLVASGIQQARIATYCSVSMTTLQKHYAIELEIGLVERLEKVANTLFDVATDKDHKACAAAAMFILKCQGGWRETADIEEIVDTLRKFVDGPPQETREQWEARKEKERISRYANSLEQRTIRQPSA